MMVGAGRRLLGVLGVVFCMLFFGCEESGRRIELSTTSGEAMGTSWKLVIRSSERKADQFEDRISAVLGENERRFSNWNEESEVSQLERGEGETSVEMKALLELSGRVKKESEGAFDVSWDGGLDLAGIAKGWAVDRVGDELLRAGLKNFVFELGGEVVARGSGPAGDGWEVQVEAPDPLGSERARTVFLRDEALATSGNYHQPEHLKDGRTGKSVKGEFRSVTVLMASCAEADAWATALFVLGEVPEDFEGEVYWNE